MAKSSGFRLTALVRAARRRIHSSTGRRPSPSPAARPSSAGAAPERSTALRTPGAALSVIRRASSSGVAARGAARASSTVRRFSSSALAAEGGGKGGWGGGDPGARARRRAPARGGRGEGEIGAGDAAPDKELVVEPAGLQSAEQGGGGGDVQRQVLRELNQGAEGLQGCVVEVTVYVEGGEGEVEVGDRQAAPAGQPGHARLTNRVAARTSTSATPRPSSFAALGTCGSSRRAQASSGPGTTGSRSNSRGISSAGTGAPPSGRVPVRIAQSKSARPRRSA